MQFVCVFFMLQVLFINILTFKPTQKITTLVTQKYFLNKSIINSRDKRNLSIYGQIAKKEDEIETQKEKLVSIPYEGIVGAERGTLFRKPVDVYDPMKDTSDLPGEDGSEEKIAAILKRIEERVQVMKSKGEWDETDEFGNNPLANKPIYETMIAQLQSCKPFESFDELALTYLLVLGTTIFLTIYLVSLREGLNGFMLWFTGNDFDSDFMNSVMRNISA